MKRSGPGKSALKTLFHSQARRTNLAIAVLLSVVAILATLALPLGIRALVDSAARRASSVSLATLAIGLFALFAVRGIAGFQASYLIRITGERVVADLRNRLFGHLNRLSADYLGAQSTGDLISRLTNDVASVRIATTDALVSLIAQTTNLVGSAAIMATMNWHVAIFVLAIMPFGALVSRRFGDRLQSLSTSIQDQLARASEIAEEVLVAFPVVKAFNREDYETQRYIEASEEAFKKAKHAARTGSLLNAVIEFLFTGVTVGIFWYGGSELHSEKLSTGALVAFLFYSQNIAQSVSSLSQTYSKFRIATGAASRLSEILAIGTEASLGPVSRRNHSAGGSLVFRNIGFELGTVQILRDISLTVDEGESVAIVGPSGAGKSTLLNLVLGFRKPTTGEVLLAGTNITYLHPHELRNHIGYVPQEVQLFNASIMDNIKYGRSDATETDVIAAARAANIDEFVRRLPNGYDTRIGVRGTTLSGGERQRISLARALIKQPDILLLDEPTSAVDATSEALIQDAIRNLMRNRTVILVTHRLTSLAKFGRIVVLSGGSIVQTGSPDTLREVDGVYKKLTESAFNLGVASASYAEPLDRLQVTSSCGFRERGDN